MQKLSSELRLMFKVTSAATWESKRTFEKGTGAEGEEMVDWRGHTGNREGVGHKRPGRGEWCAGE